MLLKKKAHLDSKLEAIHLIKRNSESFSNIWETLKYCFITVINKMLSNTFY